MVYKYIRKSDRASWSEENLIAAVEKVKRNEIALKNASELYEIPYTTLRKHVQRGSSKKFLGRYKPVFDMKEEAELVNYINKMDEIFFGLTKTDICSLAYKFADNKDIDHPFRNETAGDQWYTSFMLRHPEVRLTPVDRANISRPKASYDSQIKCFFELLKTLLQKYKFPLKKIYSMGEICIHCLEKQPPRIIAVEDGKQLLTNCEQNEVLITAIFCCSAVGSFIPPALIFPAEKFNEKLFCDFMCMRSKNGCNDSDICLDWLKYFIECTRPVENEKVLLILENHEWYRNVEFLDYAIANNVVILSLPHRCSHKLHPLHISVFGSTRSHFQDIAQNCWNDDSDSVLNVKRIFIEAYLKSVKLQNAIKGFEESGILKCHKDFLSKDCCIPEICQTIDNGSFLEKNFSLVKREKINSIRIDLQKKSEARRNRVIKAPIFKTFSLSQNKVVKKLPKKSKPALQSPISSVQNNFKVPEPPTRKIEMKEESDKKSKPHSPISTFKNDFKVPKLRAIKTEVEKKSDKKSNHVLHSPTVKNHFKVPKPPVNKSEVKDEADESVVQIIYELELDF